MKKRIDIAVLIYFVATLIGCSESVSDVQPPDSASAALRCDCGPDYCKGDPRYLQALAAKKRDLAANYPSELVDILDRGGACVARVEQSPGVFSIMSVAQNGDTSTSEWSDDQEEAAKRGLLAGRYSAYYKFNTKLAFQCCGDLLHDKRDDWDSTLEMNTKLAIRCRKVGESADCR